MTRRRLMLGVDLAADQGGSGFAVVTSDGAVLQVKRLKTHRGLVNAVIRAAKFWNAEVAVDGDGAAGKAFCEALKMAGLKAKTGRNLDAARKAVRRTFETVVMSGRSLVEAANSKIEPLDLTHIGAPVVTEPTTGRVRPYQEPTGVLVGFEPKSGAPMIGIAGAPEISAPRPNRMERLIEVSMADRHDRRIEQRAAWWGRQLKMALDKSLRRIAREAARQQKRPDRRHGPAKKR